MTQSKLKLFCYIVSLGYVGLALFIHLMVLDALFFHMLGFNPDPNFSEAICGFFIVGFFALFVGTIVMKINENKKKPTSARSPKTPMGNVVTLITFLIWVNVFIHFLGFASVTSGDHGIPEISGDGRYVMAYRGEIIREIDEDTYYRELYSYRSKSLLLVTSVMLFFTWGIFTNHIPENKNRHMESG